MRPSQGSHSLLSVVHLLPVISVVWMPRPICVSSVITALSSSLLLQAVCQLFALAVEFMGMAAVCTLFSSIALLGCWYARVKVPETRGRSMDVIEQEMTK